MGAWAGFLSAMLLTLVRVSGILVFAPFFSASAIPVRAKAVFAGAVAVLLAPLVATLPRAHAEIDFAALIGELAVGLIYGLILALLNEMLLFAGEIAGLQFSFSAVNLLDPTSSIQTPLMGDLFQLVGTLVLMQRVWIASCWLRWCEAFVPCHWGPMPFSRSLRMRLSNLRGGFFWQLSNWRPRF
jgi:flagellar biosynthesis protein FliR